MLLLAIALTFTDPQVVVAPDAPKTVRIASGEFAKYYREVTGRQVVAKVEAPKVFLAVDQSLDAEHDEYRIVSTTNGVRLVGANGRAVLYAVYDFFERQDGCRWFWDGDRVPKRETIPLDGLDVREKARFEYRGIRYFAHRGLARFQAEHWGLDDWKREIDWCLKRRLNLMMPRIGMDDTWQKAFPDIVPYPDPSAPCGDRLGGYDNRVSYWGLKYRGELRKAFTEYAFDRELMIPTDFGTMTHWYARTPVPFLEKKNPPFLPQAGGNYGQRTGLVWDIFQGEWLEDYWRLTEAFLTAGYGKPDLLHTIGLGERKCFTDRAKNLRLKKDVLSKITGRALKSYPQSKILLAGWDFYDTWQSEEVRSFVPELDPKTTIIWDYEGDAEKGCDPWKDNPTEFTQWDVIGKFPYTFGIFLAYEQALDIRARYGLIERREKLVATDSMCKGYVFWPESSHTDILLLRYFTANAWKPGQSHDELLPVFCRDRYGANAAKFESLWRKVLPISQLIGWLGNWGADLTSQYCDYSCSRDLAKDTALVESVPSILAELAAIEPADDFQRRDLVDLARTVLDRALIVLRRQMANAFDAWVDGKGSADEARRLATAYRGLVCAATDLLALHSDFSMCETLERMALTHPGVAPDFGRILLDNAINDYCRSHQYEIAAGWYRPYADALIGEMLRRLDAGEKAKADRAVFQPLRAAAYNRLVRDGIAKYRPNLPRTTGEFRRVLRAAGTALAPPRPLSRSVVYQLVFRTFTREGTIAAAMPLLDHVRETGVDIVYLSPFVKMDDDPDSKGWSPRQMASGFESPKNPYRIADYDAIDPEYGTEAELKAFVDRAHALGMRVVFDLVYLHCGPNNVIRRKIPEAFETNPDGSVRETKWRFPYVNFKSPTVREYLWANMTRFVREFDCDGFRCDVGDDVPIDFWTEGFRRCREFKPDLITINEGDKFEWLEKGFQAGYAWTIANSIRDKLRGIDRTPFSKRQKEMAAYDAKLPPKALRFVFMDNHDTANDDGARRVDRMLPVAAGNAGFVAEYLMRGVAVVHNGNEIADRSRSSFFAPVGHPLRTKYTVDWSGALTVDGRNRFALLRRLAELRHTHPCFGDAAMEYLDTSEPERVLAFRRTAKDGRRAVVAVNLTKDDCAIDLPGTVAAELLTAGAEMTPDGRLRLSPYGFLAIEIK